MRKQRFKTIRLFLKLILLLQIYSLHKFTTEASENHFPESFDKFEFEAKKEIDGSVLERPQRPARLLPLKMILGKEKNKTESENMRFYGPATNCEELLKIGYTRNGFYLVKGSATSNSSHVEIIDCLFKNPNGIKEIKEKRLGFVPLTHSSAKLPRRRSIQNFLVVPEVATKKQFLSRPIRPARLLPLHLFYGKDKNETEEQVTVQRFYGPPCNCSELGKLGYTLNGYYLINTSKNRIEIGIVFCRFLLPPGENENSNEEQVGLIRLDQITFINGQSPSSVGPLQAQNEEINEKQFIPRKFRPARILPNRYYAKGKENGTGAEQNNIKHLNSNPFSCNDVRMLGYTLNGYYLVNGSDVSLRFGVVFCQFKLPPGAITAKTEERLGFITLLDIHTINQNKDVQASEEHDDSDSSEVVTSTSSSTTKPSSAIKRKTVNTRPTKFHAQTLTSSMTVTTKAPVYCTNLSIRVFHLKNDERNICLGLRDGPFTSLIMENLFIRWKCDNRSALQWTKDPIPLHKTRDGSMRLCHSSGDKCLAADRQFQSGKYAVRVSHYDPNRRSQQWKIKRKTGQLMNIETQLCLTSYSNSESLRVTSNYALLYVLETCSDDEKYITAQQKWSLVEIPDCDDEMR